MPPSDQCAVGTDGKLLDPCAITGTMTWRTLLPSRLLHHLCRQHLLYWRQLLCTLFFRDRTTLASAVLNTGGVCRSSRVSKPSKCVLDANNMGQNQSRHVLLTKQLFWLRLRAMTRQMTMLLLPMLLMLEEVILMLRPIGGLGHCWGCLCIDKGDGRPGSKG